ncbi:hypothetical protein CHS0354_001929 [Potamilus streckersoni]|uniref:Uncharacterized protein n=1 Tax=Potamilus streckersoni TaxID=2493646 RepID=A0AAE0SBE2_9BIVA|nr:hypothetical protein CHS0354_001929 [Potamilus streckersoni]
MYWLDYCFTGDLEKEIMLEECGMLKALLRKCFTAVNQLIYRIEENFPGEKLEKIHLQTSACLGDNCIIIIERINQIEKLLEEREFDVETRMDTKLFKELKNRSKKFEINIIKISNTITRTLSAIYGASERENLDHAVDEYARAVDDFKPGAGIFCWNIGKVIELIEVYNKK